MAEDEQYRRQVGLPVRVPPSVADEWCCLPKGGTAINVFVPDPP